MTDDRTFAQKHHRGRDSKVDRDIVRVLLESEHSAMPIVNIMDEADRSRSSYYDHRDELVAEGLIEEDKRGYTTLVSIADQDRAMEYLGL